MHTRQDGLTNLSFECRKAVFATNKDIGSDLRLNVRLFRKCQNDYKKFCKDVEPVRGA
jgi:hypothetical protein